MLSVFHRATGTRENTCIMPLELRTQRDGRLRDTWYGRYEINGKLLRINLDVKIAGTPPASLSLREEGDGAFERSRATAQAKLDGIVQEARSGRSAERLAEMLYEATTGETIRSVKLDELAAEWARLPRKHEPDERYAAQCQSTLKRFAEFVRTQNGRAVELGQVTRNTARAFMAAETERNVSGKTWNDTMKLLRAAFHHLLPPGALNPFEDMPTKDTDTVFRKPFTPEELKAILDAAKNDDFIRPIIITGMCTAMRRGDCCLLKWKDVDMARRFITVKTAKTGQTVSIPIFGLLRDELQKQAKSRKQKAEKGELVFPDQAAMYTENPDGITWRVKKVLAVALGAVKPTADALPEVSEAEAKRRGHEFIAGLPESEKKGRMLAVFDAYMDGKKTSEVKAAAGVSKGSVSGYLNEIERAVKCQIVRGRPEGGSVTAALKTDSSLLRTKRSDSERAASVRDFHSLRVSWVTIALTGGVPLELVQKVTGHKTTDIVLKHYFQPGREDFRMALQSAMPNLLTNGHQTPKEEMREMLATVRPVALRERPSVCRTRTPGSCPSAR